MKFNQLAVALLLCSTSTPFQGYLTLCRKWIFTGMFARFRITGVSFKCLPFVFVSFFLLIYMQLHLLFMNIKEWGIVNMQVRLKSLYVNSSNIILLYFDTPVERSQPNQYGFNISYDSAAAIDINQHPEFATYFYSTALAAQASGRNVSIQMRGVQSGYLKIDRIWLHEN